MKHYGDITKINGAEVEPVWIITGGSPCQDLSIAGRRAGLDGERSGLFMEQIRIIKEMREYDRAIRGTVDDIRCIRPRFMVWENVPGAFSSNNGEDFRIVLEETAKVADKDAVIPRPDKGKWSPSGCIMGNGWSIAWRVHDAQFWGKTIRDVDTGDVLTLGTPQRRRRISLVADFGGQSAPEILFERKGLSGNFEQSEQTGKKTATAVRESAYGAGTNIPYDGLNEGGCSLMGDDIAPTLISRYETQTGNTQDKLNVMQKTLWDGSQISPTLTANNANGAQRMPDKDNFNAIIARTPFSFGNGQLHDAMNLNEEVAKTLNCMRDPAKILYLDIVRRLTPLECERLQGYPDNWTDIGEWVDSKGKRHKDADNPRYKALGNSIALPFWQWMAQKMINQLKEDGVDQSKMASLFDGIGGFPLVYSRCGCEPVWASEIDEFPIAVTKVRFPEERGEKNESNNTD